MGDGMGRNGRGVGMPGRGAGMGAGMGVRSDLTNVPSGTLTAAQKTQLAAMAEEEKLAHDLYVAFADRCGTTVFTRIPNAETRHLEAVRMLMERYAVADPTAGRSAGAFSTASAQHQYNKLLSQGTASVDAALAAARTVETLDITDLKAAATGVTAPQTHTCRGKRDLWHYGGIRLLSSVVGQKEATTTNDLEGAVCEEVAGARRRNGRHDDRQQAEAAP